MSYGYQDPFPAAAPQVQIQRVGEWKLFAGAILAAVGLGFAGFVYLVPYQKLAKVVKSRAGEVSQERGSVEELTAERDKLKAALEKRVGTDQDKAAEVSKQSESLQDLAGELKTALAAANANVTTEGKRVRIAFPVASLFEQATSSAVSPPGTAALKVVVEALKKAKMRAYVRPKLIFAPPPRELAQFKAIAEFEVLRAARVMLVMAGAGVPADHLTVEGDLPPGGPRKGRMPVPDRLNIEIESE